MVKLFSKNINLCDHNSTTSQTHRRTERQTTCDRNTALCTKVHRAVKMRLNISPFQRCNSIETSRITQALWSQLSCFYQIEQFCIKLLERQVFPSLLMSRRSGTILLFITRSHVRECCKCKDDRQSQWGMAKFDPQPTLNPWTDRHQMWNTWLRRGYLPPQKIRGQSAQGFLPPTYVKYTPQPSNVYFFFSQFFRMSIQTRSLDRFSRLIRHTTWFCAR